MGCKLGERSGWRSRWLAMPMGWAVALGVGGGVRGVAADRPVDGIMDNSFLVEEAYNQEPGMVQHILTGSLYMEPQEGPDDRVWAINFTQEWPLFSQTHQVSYTIPYLFLESGGGSGDGFGDVTLNYRWQAWFDPETLRALAPRVSAVLPTGAWREGLGDDAWGLQFNLPASAAWGERWFTHANAGLTYLPEAVVTGGSDAVHYNLGASVIYALSENWHLMLEWTGTWLNAVDPPGTSDRYLFTTVVSPGFRKAFNLAGDAQLVLGLAAPIGLNGDSPDVGVFLYASFEHFFHRPSGP